MKYFERNDKVINARFVLLTLIDIAQQRRCSPDKLLKGTALFYPECLDENVRVSQQQVVQLVKNAKKLLKQDDLSFQLGRRMFPANLGQLGNALLHCRNLSAMLRICRLHQADIFPWLYVSTQFDETYCYLHFNPAISIEFHEFHVFLFEMVTSAIVRALKMRMSQWPALDIQFPYAEPNYIEQYQVNLPCQYRFVSAMGLQPLQIKFEKSLLATSFTEYSNYLSRFYRHQVEKSDSCYGLIQSVLQRIKKQPQLTLEQLACSLNMSSATLKRKLAFHHTSFQQLRDIHRQQIAVFQLTEQQKCNEDVAHSLNFSDITNFRRAVKRWTGLTPDKIRQKIALS